MITKGIDKATITNISIIAIEFNKLLDDNDVTLSSLGAAVDIYDLESEQYKKISYISITDTVAFNKFTMGVKIDHENLFSYCFLELNIKALNGDNLTPLTVTGYKNLIENVSDYLKSRYGIHLNTNNAKFKCMEVNCNIELDENFNEYKQLFKTFIHLAPKHYKDRLFCFENDSFTGAYVKNKTIECKFYNKTKQLDKVCQIKLDTDVLRIEYKFMNEMAIKKVFNSNELNMITDNQISDFLKNRINKDFIKTTERYINECDKQIIDLVEDLTHKKNWLNELILHATMTKYNEELSILFDIKQLEYAIKKVIGKNYKRTINNLHDKIDKLNLENSMIKNYINNIEKLEFIKAAII